MGQSATRQISPKQARGENIMITIKTYRRNKAKRNVKNILGFSVLSTYVITFYYMAFDYGNSFKFLFISCVASILFIIFSGIFLTEES